jgi:hypothetical protein
VISEQWFEGKGRTSNVERLSGRQDGNRQDAKIAKFSENGSLKDQSAKAEVSAERDKED